VGGFGLYLQYRARSQPFRERLYETQLAFVLDAVVAADELRTMCLRVSIAPAHTRDEARENAWRIARDFYPTLARASAVMPLPVHQALNVFTEAVREYLAEATETPAKFTAAEDAAIGLILTLRHFAGVQPLSGENLKMFRSFSDDGEH